MTLDGKGSALGFSRPRPQRNFQQDAQLTNATYREQLEELSSQLQSLENAYNAMAKDRDLQYREVERYEQQVAELATEIERQKSTIKKLQKQCIDRESTLIKLVDYHEEELSTMLAKEEELEQCRKQCSQLKMALQLLRVQLKKAQENPSFYPLCESDVTSTVGNTRGRRRQAKWHESRAPKKPSGTFNNLLKDLEALLPRHIIKAAHKIENRSGSKAWILAKTRYYIEWLQCVAKESQAVQGP